MQGCEVSFSVTFPLTDPKGVYKRTDFENRADTLSRIPSSTPGIIKCVENLPTLGDMLTFVDLPTLVDFSTFFDSPILGDLPTFVHLTTLVDFPTFLDLPYPNPNH